VAQLEAVGVGVGRGLVGEERVAAVRHPVADARHEGDGRAENEEQDRGAAEADEGGAAGEDPAEGKGGEEEDRGEEGVVDEEEALQEAGGEQVAALPAVEPLGPRPRDAQGEQAQGGDEREGAGDVADLPVEGPRQQRVQHAEDEGERGGHVEPPQRPAGADAGGRRDEEPVGVERRPGVAQQGHQGRRDQEHQPGAVAPVHEVDAERRAHPREVERPVLGHRLDEHREHDAVAPVGERRAQRPGAEGDDEGEQPRGREGDGGVPGRLPEAPPGGRRAGVAGSGSTCASIAAPWARTGSGPGSSVADPAPCRTGPARP
jgi:hypothetical protein